jgi:hypothetical protein
MELLCMMERNMKAILLNKMTNPEDVPNFITKKVIPLMNSVMGKLYFYLINLGFSTSLS